MADRATCAELAANRKDWDALVPYHFDSTFYGVDSFLKGRSTLGSLELRGVGSVREKQLLHLQCHLGLDTLSWARRGAVVTGVDFSLKAIEAARKLALTAHLSAEFIKADVYRLPPKLKDRFDIVFASWGVLAWLPDMAGWARAAASCLREDGFLYLLDHHPVIHIFDDALTQDELRVSGSYFHHKRPEETTPGSYAAGRNAPVSFPRHQWQQSIQDILGGVIGSGLIIESFLEHEMLPHQQFPFLRRGRDNYWRMPADGARIPLSFSLKARKPGA